MKKTEFGTIKFEGKNYAMLESAHLQYRSHNANGWQILNPNGWYACKAIDGNNEELTIWWEMKENPTSENEEDACDWENPNDITKE